MNPRRVLFTSAPMSAIAELTQYLGGQGWEVINGIGCKNLLELIREQSTLDGLILGLEEVGPQECAALVERGCRFLSRDGVGVDNINHHATKQSGITVSKTAGANRIAVAEHTFALLLAANRNLVTCHGELARGGWKSVYGRDLCATTLGLFGLGHVGREVARTAALGFNMNVVAYDPAQTPTIMGFRAQLPAWISACGSRGSFKCVDSADEVLQAADHISLNMELQAPGGPSNAGFFNRVTIAKCRKGAVLINTARGGLVVEDDLIEALSSGHISAAGLDVFEQEPLAADSPLRSMPNVICTAHIASKSMPARFTQGKMAVDNLTEMFANGNPLPGNLVILVG